MKKATVVVLFLNLAMLLSAQNSVEITYVANDGFLISNGAKSVLIDALFDTSYGRFDVPAESIKTEMTEGKAPFKKVDLFLVTHIDGDHYSAPLVTAFLKRHKETKFVSSGQVTESLANESAVSKQVTTISEEIGGMFDTVINNIPLKICRVKHLYDTLGKGSVNLTYLISLNNIKILHIGDGPFDFNKSYYEQFQMDKEKIDILFLEYFGQSDEKIQFVKEVIKPKYIVGIHIPPKDIETESKKFLSIYPNGFVFKKQLETRIFTSSNN